MTNFSIPILLNDVGQVNIVTLTPITAYSILKKFSIFTDEALVTIPALGIVDMPAVLLRAVQFQHILPPGSNLDYLVRMPAGTETVEGIITGISHP